MAIKNIISTIRAYCIVHALIISHSIIFAFNFQPNNAEAIAPKFPQQQRSIQAPKKKTLSSNNPIEITGQHDLLITNCTITGGRTPDLILRNCYNITITRNRFLKSSGTGISLYNCHNVVIKENFFTEVSTGVYAQDCPGGKITVSNNQFLNMQGPFPRGQCVQFNTVSGDGNEITDNRCENIAGKSNPEDAISLYKSNGTRQSPIIVSKNWIRGGGPSKSGGGIMLGDSGGSNQLAADNILIDPGQYGIAISGGDRMAIIKNFIYARPQNFTNVGIYVAAYNGTVCTNTTVKLNKVNFFNRLQKPNNYWIGPQTDIPVGLETNSWGAAIGSSLLPTKIINQKLK